MALFAKELESERLRYEYLHPDAFDPMELYEHARAGAPHIEEITRYVTWDPYDHPREAFDWVSRCGTEFEEGEGVTYAIRPREGEHAGELAGLAGLGVDWDHQTGGFGTWFRKPFWGEGYSGERAARLLEVAFERLDLELITVSHDPDNEKSQKAIQRYVERFGGRKVGRIRNDAIIGEEIRDSIRYEISREEWEKHR